MSVLVLTMLETNKSALVVCITGNTGRALLAPASDLTNDRFGGYDTCGSPFAAIFSELVAKFNGLLPNSVLGAGREIKIPGK